MRIAFVCADPGVPVFGRKGCSIHVQEMLRAFLKHEARIDLFAARLGGDCPPGLDAVHLVEIPEVRQQNRPEDDGPVHLMNETLRDALNRRGPFDFIYERYSLWSYAGMEFAQTARVPGVLEVNAPLIEEQQRYRRLTAPELAQSIAARTFAAASALCAVSSQVAQYLEGFPKAQGRIQVIHNGVDPARFALRRGDAAASGSDANASGSFTVGFVGSLKPWHGLSTLATAFARLHHAHSDARLLVVGDGPEREHLVTQLVAAGGEALAATRLAGAVPPEDIPQYLSQMDVAVAPYSDREGFYFSPLKIFEYMAAALPTVASRVGDLPSIIRHEVDGVLCVPGDASEFAAALATLRANPELRCRMGAAARDAVCERHTWDSVAERILALATESNHSANDFSLSEIARGPSASVVV